MTEPELKNTTEQMAIDEWLRNHDGGYTEDFSGKNCNDFEDTICGGWTYGNRRCECGNRRVYLHTEKDENGQWSAWAEAW